MKKKWALSIVLVVLSKFTLLAALPVPPELKKIVVFIFAPTETGIRPMGTGFFVGVQTSEQPGRFRVYLVTARHVLQEPVNERAEGAETRFYPLVFVRLTKKGGGTKLLPLPLVTGGAQKNIFVHDDPTVDLAVVPVLPDQEEYEFKFLPDEFLTTKDSFAELKIREGHEVFFTGLFLPHLGSEANYPVVRFGRVALVTDERIRWKGVELTFNGSHSYKSPMEPRPTTRKEPFMNVQLQQAAQCFQEAVGLSDQQQNPGLWDIASGLWAMSRGLDELDNRLAQIESRLETK